MRLALPLVLSLAALCGCPGDDDSSADAEQGTAGGGGQHASRNEAGGGTQSHEAGSAGHADCAAPQGTYEATYTARSGTCGELAAPARVPFDGSSAGTVIQRFAASDVTTEVAIEDCAVRVIQVVEDGQGEEILRITADLTVDGADMIGGTAMVTRYERGAVACTGTYDVQLRASSTTIGGATRNDAGMAADAGAGDAGADLPPDVEAKVEYDCVQTVQCTIQRGSELPPDPIAQCIEDTGRWLAADANRVATYLEVVAACERFVVCEYIECAQAQH